MYKVIETAQTGFSTRWEGNVSAIDGKTQGFSNTTSDYLIDSQTTPALTFINNDNDGPVTINKKVVSPVPAEATQEFHFQIKLKDSDGNALTGEAANATYDGIKFTNAISDEIVVRGNGSKTIDGLPIGTTYEVVEAEANSAAWATTSTGETGTITSAGSKADFTNTHKPGALEVSKKVVSSTTTDHHNMTQFKFRVTLTTITGQKLGLEDGDYGQMTFADDVSEFSLADGQTIRAGGLPVGVHYEVEEYDVAKGWVVTKTGDTGEITADKTSKAAFTNTRDEGGLIVNKKVESAIEADKNQKFTFMVGLYASEADREANKTADINGQYGEMRFSKGICTFDLADGETRSTNGLPVGLFYRVYEGENSDFTTTWQNQDGQITKGTEENAILVRATNTRKTGELDVAKTVISPVPAEETTEFTFTVTLTFDGVPVSGTFGDEGKTAYTFDENGQTTVRVKGGDTEAITGLPINASYNVVEDSVDGFSLTGTVADTGIIKSTKTTAKFTNKRDTGDLEINKKVVSDASADKNIKFNFTIDIIGATINGKFGDVEFTDSAATFELAADETKHITGLPSGVNYTVTEDTADGFVTRANSVVRSTARGAIVADTTATADFENTRETGRLEIFKIVDSSTQIDHATYFTFRVTLPEETGINKTYPAVLTDQDGNMVDTEVTFTDGVAEVKLRDDEDMRTEELPMAIKYLVEEVDVENPNYSKAWGFSWNKDDVLGKYTSEERPDEQAPTGIIDARKRAQVDFHNVRKEGFLYIREAIDSKLASDEGKDFTFRITLDSADVDGRYGSMNFKKNEKAGTSEAIVSVKPGDVGVSAIGLPYGVKYTITEVFDESEEGVFATKTWTDVDENEAADGVVATGTIGDEEHVDVYYKNTRNPGKLTVSKEIVSDRAADADQMFTFNLTFYGLTEEAANATYETSDGEITLENGKGQLEVKADTSCTIEGLPLGVIYTISEATTDGFQLTGRTNETGTLEAATKAVFTNTRTTSSLTLSKALLTATKAAQAQQFTFVVTFDGLTEDALNKTFGTGDEAVTLVDGVATITVTGTVTIKGLPTGVSYTITEESVDGFELVGITNAEGDINAEGAVATITNQPIADLELSKRLFSGSLDDFETEFFFTLTLDDTSINGTYGDLTFEDGVAKVEHEGELSDLLSLKSGDTIVAKGLPVGVGYTITEEFSADYRVVGVTVNGVESAQMASDGTISNVITGTLGEDGTKVEFINQRTGSLRITKHIPAEHTLTDEEKQAIVFTVNDSNGEVAKLSDGTVVGGPKSLAEFTDVDAEGNPTWIINDLPEGTYFVIETLLNKKDSWNEGDEIDTITYKVDDETQLLATVDFMSQTTAEVNVYNDYKSVSWIKALEVTKALSGDADDYECDEEFTFVLTKAEDFAGRSDALPGNDTISIKANETGAFGNIGYSELGSYYYNITEVAPETPTVGMTYATAPMWAKVVVSEDGINAYYGDSKEAVDAQAEPNTLTVTNEFTNRGKLKVTKVISGAELTDEQKAAMTFTVTGPDGAEEPQTITNTYDQFDVDEEGNASWTIDNLKPGTYTVTEENADIEGYARTTEYSVEEGQVAVAANETAEVTVTNTYTELGSAKIRKTFQGLPEDADTSALEFRITDEAGEERVVIYAEFTDGEYVIAEQVPLGTTYTVEEVNADTPVASYRLDADASTTSGTATVGTDEGILELTNVYVPESYSFNVKKVVDSPRDEDKQYEYKFKVTLYASEDKEDVLKLTGTYGDMEFTDGVAELTLKDGQTASATGFEQQVLYVVEETDTNGLISTQADDDETSTTTVTNTFAPYSFRVKKTVVSSRSEDKEKSYKFRVTLYGDKDKEDVVKLTGTYGDMEFKDGVAEFSLKHDEVKVATGFEEQVWYGVEETDAGGLTSSQKIDDKTATTTVTNTYNPPTTPPNNPPKSPTVGTTTTTKVSTPKTGDPTSYAPIAALAVAGIVFAAIGLRRRRMQ